jgi:hypothetical protein
MIMRTLARLKLRRKCMESAASQSCTIRLHTNLSALTL